MPTNQYEIPRYGIGADTLLGWLLEARQEGEAWLAAQKPATMWAGAVALMDEADKATDSATMSNTQYPKAKRIARELVASLASFRHEGEVKVLWDNTLYDQAHLLTDLDNDWYERTFAYMAHRAALQTGVVKGTAYLFQEWDKHFWGPYKGDTRLSSLDPSCVTFVQLPADNDIQRAYMVIIKEELPINLAKRIYGPENRAFAEALVPDQESPSWLAKGLEKVQQFLSPALRVAGRTRQTANGSFPTVNIYKAYTLDGSVNRGFEPLDMGARGTNWSYTVPFVGSELPTALMNPRTGSAFTRPADESDCLMFPLRRLSIFSNTGVCYDGSAFSWHGDVPLARIRFNDLPWESLGGSLIADVRTMEQGVTALMRGMEDSAAARLDPPAIYDDTVVSSTWAKAFNPRLAGVRGAAPLQMGDPIKFPIDPRTYDVGPWIPEFMAAQEQRMDYLTAVHDMVAIAKAKQVPGADTLEKLMEMAGPIVQDLVRALEQPLTQLGTWRISDKLQFYNSARIIRAKGPDVPLTPDDWTPDRLAKYLETPAGQKMVRRYGEGNLESILQEGSFQFRPEMLLAGSATQTPKERSAALKRMISEFCYEVTESGINEIHRMTTKLFYLQLMKEGFPISWWTFAKIAKVPNFGPPPEGTNTEMERWVAQQHMKIELQADLQSELQQVMGQMGPEAAGGAPASPPGEPQNIPGLEGSNGNSGRPQSYKRPPRLVQKSGGTRSTVTTA